MTRLPGLRSVPPAELLLAARMAAWTPVLPILKHVVPLPRLVRLMTPRPAATARDPQRHRRIAAISRRLYRTKPITRRDNCLERSLVAFRYLTRAGADPTLVVGFRRDGEDMHGHVWVLLDGEPLHERSEEIEAYTPVTVFGTDGRASSAGGAAGARPGA